VQQLVSKIAAGAGSIPLGRTAVVTLTTTGHLDVAACYDTTAIAQRQAARLRGTPDVNVYLVRKHRGGTTVYLDQDTVLGTVDAPAPDAPVEPEPARMDWTERESRVFNAITRTLGERRRFASLSDRVAVTTAVLTELDVDGGEPR
jgi:hypothetical protein